MSDYDCDKSDEHCYYLQIITSYSSYSKMLISSSKIDALIKTSLANAFKVKSGIKNPRVNAEWNNFPFILPYFDFKLESAKNLG